MRLDHVIYGVRDLDEAAVRLNLQYGLDFLPGGRHPGGTVNSSAPLAPTQYLELLAVEERGDDFSRHCAALIERGRTLLGWGIEVDDVGAVALRLGLEVEKGSITHDDGSTGSWHLASDASDLSLPFFIAYRVADPDARRRRWEDAVNEAGNQGFGGFTFIEVGGGDEERIRAFPEGGDLPVRFVDGRPGLHAVGIAGPGAEFVLRDPA